MVVRLVEILSTIGALHHEGQGGMVRQLIRKSTTPEKNILMSVKSLVFRIATGEIVPLIVEVQFEFQMFHEIRLDAY